MADKVNRLKIAVWHNLPSGGGARALNMHLQGLLARGHEIELWAADPSASGFIELPPEIKTHTVPLGRFEQANWRDKLRSFFLLPERNVEAMKTHCQTCAEEINQGGFDVLFANSCYYYAAPFINRYAKIPVVLYHGEPRRYFYESKPYMPWYPPGDGQIHWLQRSYWKLFFRDLWQERMYRVEHREERKNIDAVDTLLVNSIFSSESCYRAYERSGDVCYLGVNTELFRPTDSSKMSRPYVIGLGNIYTHKNPLLAVETVALLPENQRPALVWVANMKDDAYFRKVQETTREKGVQFEVLEMISDDELVQWLSGAEAMLYTSNLEPFGLAPLEANACGTPVIGVAQGGVRETVIDGKNGYLCPPQAADLVDKLRFLLENPAERKRMSDFAVENVRKNWTFEAAINRLEKYLREAVS